MGRSQAGISARTARRRGLAVTEAAGGRLLALAAATQSRAAGANAARLAHELAIGHYLMMRLAAEADSFIARLDPDAAGEHPRTPREALRLANGAARLMDRYRRGLVALPSVRGSAPDRVPTPAVVIRPESNSAANLRPSAAPPTNRGWLRHGNRPGDFLAAPRCGACTRAGTACRQPAMRNGRCRFHGGKSTGPRTAAGLARSQSARLVHGGHGERLRALRAAAAQSCRTLARLTPARRGVLAGYGVHPTDRPSRVLPGGGAPPGSAARHRPIDAPAETPTICS
jgi:hypothetical protein